MMIGKFNTLFRDSIFKYAILILLLYAGCAQKPQINPRTIQLANCTFLLPPDDTATKGIFKLITFIQISDTGNCILMNCINRDKEEYYSIKLPDTLKEQLFALASIDSLYKTSIDSNSYNSAIDDYPIYLSYRCDTSMKEIAYSLYHASPIRIEIVRLLNQIQMYSTKTSIAKIDLSETMKSMERIVLKYTPPPPLISVIKFDPPIPKEDLK